MNFWRHLGALGWAVAVRPGAGLIGTIVQEISYGSQVSLFNVWGIIWPNNKRVIAWTKENAEKGTAIPAEAAALGRQAFLASRSNAWLSLPMLFFMAAASHFPIFVGG